MSDDDSPKIKVSVCQICGKPAVEKHRPFCSPRCSLIDLSRWLGGNYRVPDRPVDEEEGDSPVNEDDEGAH